MARQNLFPLPVSAFRSEHYSQLRKNTDMPKAKASSFVPEGYEVKTSGGDFFKLAAGDNKFRILTDAVVGKEGWKDNKPFRRGGADAHIDADEVDMDVKTKKPKINDFMAFYVYNHNDNKIQIASFTQNGIKKSIVEYASDEDWGHPTGYDITISKSGDGLLTKYGVKPSVPKPLAAAVQKEVDLAAEFFDLENALGIDAE